VGDAHLQCYDTHTSMIQLCFSLNEYHTLYCRAQCTGIKGDDMPMGEGNDPRVEPGMASIHLCCDNTHDGPC